jgi:hypothetical protein
MRGLGEPRSPPSVLGITSASGSSRGEGEVKEFMIHHGGMNGYGIPLDFDLGGWMIILVGVVVLLGLIAVVESLRD